MRRVIHALAPAIAAMVAAGVQPGSGRANALSMAGQQPTKEDEVSKKEPNNPDAKKEPPKEPKDKAHHPDVDSDVSVGASRPDPDVPAPPKPPKHCCSGG